MGSSILYFPSRIKMFDKVGDVFVTHKLTGYDSVQKALDQGEHTYLYNILSKNSLNTPVKLTCSSIQKLDKFMYVTCYASVADSTRPYMYKGSAYDMHTGSRGGKYIVVGNKKVYVK